MNATFRVLWTIMIWRCRCLCKKKRLWNFAVLMPTVLVCDCQARTLRVHSDVKEETDAFGDSAFTSSYTPIKLKKMRGKSGTALWKWIAAHYLHSACHPRTWAADTSPGKLRCFSDLVYLMSLMCTHARSRDDGIEGSTHLTFSAADSIFFLFLNTPRGNYIPYLHTV